MYIVKIPYYSNDPFDRGWHYRYVNRIELSYHAGFDYDATTDRGFALVVTESTAEWICNQIYELGEEVEMEKV